MLPLRYDFVRFGGSWAQRQVYSVTLIQAAVRSNQISLALALVSELKVCVVIIIIQRLVSHAHTFLGYQTQEQLAYQDI